MIRAFIVRRLLPVCLALQVGSLFAQSGSQATEWLTTPDRTALLAPQARTLIFTAQSASADQPVIVLDARQPLQPIDGFGFALTGGSAELLMRMTPAKRHALLEELFGRSGKSISVSYLRLTIGSSDMNEHVFTYDDMPTGQTDPELARFALGPDLNDVVPVMREILKINPAISILGTPWSAPSWMKTNENPKGGSLKPGCYGVYAQYLAMYVQAMGRLGIHIKAITPQNEPLNARNTPSMVMTAEEELSFLKSYLGPTFRDRRLRTDVILYDHNCNHPDYPMTILADKDAAEFAVGSGFHLYEGTVDAMSKVHDAYPQKNIYFTEQMIIDEPENGPELRIAQPVSRVIIGATSNWSRNVLLWNLAADPHSGPHTNNGGCPICEGAITLAGDEVTRNLAYYTVAQVSKFVSPGSVRITTTATGRVPEHVAFRNKQGQLVLLVANTTASNEEFAIRSEGRTADASLSAGAVATYIWK